VRDHSTRHRDSDGLRHLECQTDRHPVEQAVTDQRERRQEADLRMAMLRVGGFVRVVDQDELLEAVEEQKPTTSATIAPVASTACSCASAKDLR
jgi:hypothetical protein